MRWIAAFVLIFVACTTTAPHEHINVTGPAVLGYVESATHDDFERLNDRAITQDDFVTSWAEFATWAEEAGIKARTVAPGFTLTSSTQKRIVPGASVGYVLVSSSGEVRVLEGVRTAHDLQAEVCEFLKPPGVACGGV